MKKNYIPLILGLLAYTSVYSQNNFPTPTGETTINAGNSINVFSENNTIGVKLFGTGNGFSTNSGPGYLQLHGSFIYDNGANLHFANGASVANIHSGDVNSSVAIQLNGTGNSFFNSPNSGFFGIGTSAPNAKLRVIGGGTVLGLNNIVTNTDGHLSIGDNMTNSTPTNQNWSDRTTFLLTAQDYSTIGFHDSGLRVDFIRAGGGTIQLGYDGGWGQANIGMPGGLWGSDGNVAIGTTNSHGYKLAVNGNIRAKEIKVEAGPWPDYVFKSTYKLPLLTAVKAYIDKNKHLPDMPSEAEVAKDGVNLGEMNKLLLKKVEELTLYLIQEREANVKQHKAIIQLTMTVKKQGSSLTALQSRLLTKPKKYTK